MRGASVTRASLPHSFEQAALPGQWVRSNVAAMARSPATPVAGRVVAVTGAARGIGAATAEALARKGARVAIGDLDAGLAEATAARIAGDAVGLHVDVTDSVSFRARPRGS